MIQLGLQETNVNPPALPLRAILLQGLTAIGGANFDTQYVSAPGTCDLRWNCGKQSRVCVKKPDAT